MTVTRPHSKNNGEIREIVEKIAGEMSREFGFDYNWNSETLHFNRTGVNGHISMLPGRIEVKINKSFFIPISDTFLRSRVEEYMDSYLD